MKRTLFITLLFLLPLTSFAANDEIQEAYKYQLSDLQVSGIGVVVNVLDDDLEGTRYQRFTLKISKYHKILVAHNIDLADRINNIKVGDKVKFNGEYEWSKKGGVVHRTHGAQNEKFEDGWVQHLGKTYQ